MGGGINQIEPTTLVVTCLGVAVWQPIGNGKFPLGFTAN
jgi:hypothetical protein